jgi:hypothetical protein
MEEVERKEGKHHKFSQHFTVVPYCTVFNRGLVIINSRGCFSLFLVGFLYIACGVLFVEISKIVRGSYFVRSGNVRKHVGDLHLRLLYPLFGAVAITVAGY